jgi:hypothetical protein
MANLGPRRAAFSVCAKRRKFWLMAATALAPLSLGLSEPALAQTFTTAGNDYPGGINVSTNQTPINVTLDPGRGWAQGFPILVTASWR